MSITNVGMGSGKIDRGPYFLLGIALLASKLSWSGWSRRSFSTGRGLYNYVALPGQALHVLACQMRIASSMARCWRWRCRSS